MAYSKDVKYLNWSLEKNEILKATRGISFEQIAYLIESGRILDIEENPKKLKFKEIDAALLTRALPQVDAAVIPTNYALLAGLTPEKDALCLEDKTSPYVNVIVVRCDELTSPKLLALKKCMQSDAMRAYILSEYQGAILPAF